jgi:hypothetical protein
MRLRKKDGGHDGWQEKTSVQEVSVIMFSFEFMGFGWVYSMGWS